MVWGVGRAFGCSCLVWIARFVGVERRRDSRGLARGITRGWVWAMGLCVLWGMESVWARAQPDVELLPARDLAAQSQDWLGPSRDADLAAQARIEAQGLAEREAEELQRAREARQAQEALRAKEAARQAEEQQAQARAQKIAEREGERLEKLERALDEREAQLAKKIADSQALHDQVTELVQSVEAQLEEGMSPTVAQAYEQSVATLLERVREELATRLEQRKQDAQPAIEVHERPTLRVDAERLDELRLRIIRRSEAGVVAEQSARWKGIGERYDDMQELNDKRLGLLAEVSARRRGELTGFAQRGWQSVRQELQQMRLELSVRWIRFRERFETLGAEIWKRRHHVAWELCKLGFLLLLFRWWRQRAQDTLLSLRSAMLERRKELPILDRARVLFWYLIRIRGPLEWLALGWVVARYWIPSSWLEMSLLWVMYKWILGGSLVVSWLNAFATRGIRRNERQKDRNKKLRLDTLRLLCFTAMWMGLALELADLLVGRGALYRWIRDGAWLIYIPLAVYLLARWSPVLTSRCAELESQSTIAHWVSKQKSLPGRMVGALVGAIYLLWRGAQWRIGGLLMEMEIFRRAFAFLDRREAVQQADAAEEVALEEPAACAVRRELDPDVVSERLLDIGPSKRIAKMIAWLEDGRHSLVAVVGERGSGKSSFLARLARDEQQRVHEVVVDCPKSGLAGLYAEIEAQVGVPIADEEHFREGLERKEIEAICIDNLHRLAMTEIGGLDPLDEFIAFARRWNHTVSWIIGFGSSAWRYIQRARGERAYFDEVVELRPWTEAEIGQLLSDRNAALGIAPDFSSLKISQNDEDGVARGRQQARNPRSAEESEASRTSFYRILWDYSGGNPGVALHAWSCSLFAATRSPEPVVRLFSQKSTTEIENLSLAAQFTLRSLVQLDQATREELIACTNLASQDCTGAIRTLLGSNVIERMGPWYRIRWEWYRPVMTVLLRQQLLMR